jgi:cysteine desulfurase
MAESMAKYLLEHSYNTETVYEKGMDCKRVLEKVRKELGQVFGAGADQLVFTSGGTEGNNMALEVLRQQKTFLKKSKSVEHEGDGAGESPRVLWASATAHPSQKGPCEALGASSQNWDVHFMPTTSAGTIDLQRAIEELPRPDIISIEWVNSEVGFVQPLAELMDFKETMKKEGQELYLWVDGVQGLGKCALPPKMSRIDAFVFSGHKLGAPVGVGGILLSSKLELVARSLGGGQERGWRSGTVALPLILCLRDAVMAHVNDRDAQDWSALMEGEVEGMLPLHRHGGTDYSRYIWMLDTSPVDGEILLHQLAACDIMVGLGSACRSSRKKTSATHAAMGLSPEQSRQSLRISFSRMSDAAKVSEALMRLKELWNESKKYYR